VFDASINQLKRLLLHRMNHPTTICGTQFSVAIITVSTAILDNDADPEWHFYFLVCMRYCEELYVSYPVYKEIMQGFLALAMQKSKISSLEAMQISTRLKEKGKRHTIPRDSNLDFTIDFNTAITQPDHASAGVLAQQFMELMLLDEYLEEEYT
jgi:hypothetical protein